VTPAQRVPGSDGRGSVAVAGCRWLHVSEDDKIIRLAGAADVRRVAARSAPPIGVISFHPAAVYRVALAVACRRGPDALTGIPAVGPLPQLLRGI